MAVTVTFHAQERMEQYDLPDNERFRDLIENADPYIYDKKYGSKLIILNKAGHAAAIKEDSDGRTVVTILPPPVDSWEGRIFAKPDRYVEID